MAARCLSQFFHSLSARITMEQVNSMSNLWGLGNATHTLFDHLGNSGSESR